MVPAALLASVERLELELEELGQGGNDDRCKCGVRRDNDGVSRCITESPPGHEMYKG